MLYIYVLYYVYCMHRRTWMDGRTNRQTETDGLTYGRTDMFLTTVKIIRVFSIVNYGKGNKPIPVCIIVEITNTAQICTTALFYMLASTCFGSSLPSSGSFWIRLSYVKIQIDMVVYYIMWLRGLCIGVSWFSLLCSGANLCIVLCYI
jgi:hypothetical protein